MGAVGFSGRPSKWLAPARVAAAGSFQIRKQVRVTGLSSD
jgi:hypothetical protein